MLRFLSEDFLLIDNVVFVMGWWPLINAHFSESAVHNINIFLSYPLRFTETKKKNNFDFSHFFIVFFLDQIHSL